MSTTESVKSRLGEICVHLGKISEEQLTEVLAQQRVTGQRFGDILRDRGLVSDRDIAEAMAIQLGVPFYDLDAATPDASVATLLPAHAALTYVMVPVGKAEGIVRLAMLNPGDTEAVQTAARLTGLTPEPLLAESNALRRTLNTVYDGDAVTESDLTSLLASLFPGAFSDIDDRAVPVSALASPVQTALEQINQAPENDIPTTAVGALLDALLQEAVQIGATAVSLEPQGGQALISYRLPSNQQRRALLRSAHQLSRAAQNAVVTEIKRRANLEVSERSRPQRGWLPPVSEPGMPPMDARIALLPELHGERVTLQLMRRDPVAPQLLESFNLSPTKRELLSSLLSRRGGVVLVTGPHWQETLYDLVNVLSEDEGANARTVVTCEQAVRYEIPQISQYVVEPRDDSPEAIAIAVASAVDALQGQDPDVLMVNASAAHPRIAAAVCRVSAVAAASSPLVLVGMSASGDFLDTAGAAAALKMAVGSEASASALLGVYSERRLRRLCLSCRVQEDTSQAAADQFGLAPGEPVYRAVGCSRCDNTGYAGEFNIHEVLVCDGGFSRMLRENVDAWTLRHYAVQNGLISFKETALGRVRAGLTTPAELIAHGIV